MKIKEKEKINTAAYDLLEYKYKYTMHAIF